MRRPRRNHSPVFKAQVALAALQGTETLTQLAERFDVHAHQITQWRSQLVARVTRQATLMRRMGIAAVYRRPRTSQRHRAHPVFPYLHGGIAMPNMRVSEEETEASQSRK